MRKRRTGSRRQGSKVEKLEEKLDGLVTLIKSATTGASGVLNTILVNSISGDLVLPSLGQTYGTSAVSSIGYEGYNYNKHIHNGTSLPDFVFTPAVSSTGSPSTNLPHLVHPAVEPSPEDAESYLDRFRTNFVKYLPFIVIPPSMTAHQLHQESPYLWLSIMTVASTRSPQQITLSKEVRGMFGREAYVEGTRSMDLLLAVLVYATW